MIRWRAAELRSVFDEFDSASSGDLVVSSVFFNLTCLNRSRLIFDVKPFRLIFLLVPNYILCKKKTPNSVIS